MLKRRYAAKRLRKALREVRDKAEFYNLLLDHVRPPKSDIKAQVEKPLKRLDPHHPGIEQADENATHPAPKAAVQAPQQHERTGPAKIDAAHPLLRRYLF